MANQSKKRWAFPHRSGDVPGGSRGRIINFSLGFGGSAQGRGPVSGPVRGRKLRWVRRYTWVSRYSGGRTLDGERLGTPYARGAVADIHTENQALSKAPK